MDYFYYNEVKYYKDDMVLLKYKGVINIYRIHNIKGLKYNVAPHLESPK